MADVEADLLVLARLSDRLRSMAEPALTRPREALGERSVSTAVHDLCSWAAAAQGFETPVPVLNPLASGDQLTVIGREFLAWASTQPDVDALEDWRTEVGLLRSTV